MVEAAIQQVSTSRDSRKSASLRTASISDGPNTSPVINDLESPSSTIDPTMRFFENRNQRFCLVFGAFHPEVNGEARGQDIEVGIMGNCHAVTGAIKSKPLANLSLGEGTSSL